MEFDLQNTGLNLLLIVSLPCGTKGMLRDLSSPRQANLLEQQGLAAQPTPVGYTESIPVPKTPSTLVRVNNATLSVIAVCVRNPDCLRELFYFSAIVGGPFSELPPSAVPFNS